LFGAPKRIHTVFEEQEEEEYGADTPYQPPPSYCQLAEMGIMDSMVDPEECKVEFE
jgi:hypothetical protein